MQTTRRNMEEWTSLRHRFRNMRTWALGLLILLGGPVGWSQDSVQLEYKIKAGYLFNFTKFVEWPTNPPSSTTGPWVIGVLQGGESVPVLREVLAGKTVLGRPIEVREVSLDEIDAGVRLLFVPRTAGFTPDNLPPLANAPPLLIVGETEGFGEKGGMINFVRRGDNIRLELNLQAAAARGLKISSQLAKIATLVRTTPASTP